MSKPLKDLTGKRFGRLVVQRRVFRTDIKNSQRTFWECLCDCGNKKAVNATSLTLGRTNSCGCIRADRLRAQSTHGRSSGSDKEYAAWLFLKRKCRKNGLTHDPRWEDFKNFILDIGNAPSKDMVLVLAPGEFHYSKETCRWGSKIELGCNRKSNKLISFKGVSRTYAEWSRLTGMRPELIRKRHRAGWPAEKIFAEFTGNSLRSTRQVKLDSQVLSQGINPINAKI